jgi:aminoglycoside phosphotransferase (APT) family kinase protein
VESTPAVDAPETAPIRPGEEFDSAAVERYVRERIPDLQPPLDVLQFPNGSANLTYLLRFGPRELVLRRPPFGPVAPGAHDMAREYRVLSRLWRVFDRAPRAYLLCEDPSVIGATFFVMERRRGAVVRSVIPAELAHHRDVARRVSFALVDAMADLHDVDFAAAGLADLGRPQGFAVRQVEGWKKRWDLAKTGDIELADRAYEALARTLPAGAAPSLVHNDLKLDNCQFDPADPDRVTAIFDWDMTTLGDPLFDLGTLLGYWAEPGDAIDRSPTRGLTGTPGLPSRAEIAGRYAERRRVPLAAIAWYEAFALWKTGVVVQQIYVRYLRGQTRDERFATMGDRIPQLFTLACDTLARAGLA